MDKALVKSLQTLGLLKGWWKMYYSFVTGKSFTLRGHSELNQGPAGLQPDALPLSYIPFYKQQGLKQTIPHHPATN